MANRPLPDMENGDMPSGAFRIDGNDPHAMTADWRVLADIGERLALPIGGLVYGRCSNDGTASIITIGPT